MENAFLWCIEVFNANRCWLMPALAVALLWYLVGEVVVTFKEIQGEIDE